MNGREAAQLIAVIGSCWPGRNTVTDQPALQVATWAQVMRHVDYSDAEAAVMQAVHRGDQHPPTPATIMDAIHTAREIAAGTHAPSLDLALAEVQHYVDRRGTRYGEPDEWSHPAVAAAVRAISWAALCEGGDTTRAHFLRVYGEARDRYRAQTRAATHTAIGTGKESPRQLDQSHTRQI